MVARVITVAPIGFDGFMVEVESDASKSLPSLQIVGLGNKAIDEAKERILAMGYDKKAIHLELYG